MERRGRRRTEIKGRRKRSGRREGGEENGREDENNGIWSEIKKKMYIYILRRYFLRNVKIERIKIGT